MPLVVRLADAEDRLSRPGCVCILCLWKSWGSCLPPRLYRVTTALGMPLVVRTANLEGGLSRAGSFWLCFNLQGSITLLLELVETVGAVVVVSQDCTYFGLPSCGRVSPCFCLYCLFFLRWRRDRRFHGDTVVASSNLGELAEVSSDWISVSACCL